MNQTQPSPAESGELKSDEKLLALFAHLSVFFGGIAIPLIFWAINKDKSKFVSFHSLQALFFHISYVAFIFLAVLILVFGGLSLSLLTTGAKIASNSDAPSLILIILLIVFYGALFLSLFVFFGYSIYIGIKAYQGELKKYPIIGKIVYKKIYGSI